MTKVRLTPNTVFRSFGSETVLLNLSTGQYHGIKGTGGRMLEVLVETGDLELAARQISEEYAQPLAVVRQDIAELCEALAERLIVELQEAEPGAAEPSQSPAGD